MVAIAAAPLFIKGAVVSLTFDGEAAGDYACHVSRAELVTKAGKVVTFTPLCPDGAVSEVGADEFTLELEGVQDWTAATGLARFLWDHAGEAVAFAVNAYGVAAAGDTPSMTGSARVLRPAYGGSPDEYAEFSVALPVIGTPVLDDGA